MAYKILKYPMPFTESFVMELPKLAEILRVDTVGGFPFMWVIGDLKHELDKREFKAFKTGSILPHRRLNFIGHISIEIQEELMLYVFEVEE